MTTGSPCRDGVQVARATRGVPGTPDALPEPESPELPNPPKGDPLPEPPNPLARRPTRIRNRNWKPADSLLEPPLPEAGVKPASPSRCWTTPCGRCPYPPPAWPPQRPWPAGRRASGGHGRPPALRGARPRSGRRRGQWRPRASPAWHRVPGPASAPDGVAGWAGMPAAGWWRPRACPWAVGARRGWGPARWRSADGGRGLRGHRLRLSRGSRPCLFGRGLFGRGGLEGDRSGRRRSASRPGRLRIGGAGELVFPLVVVVLSHCRCGPPCRAPAYRVSWWVPLDRAGLNARSEKAMRHINVGRDLPQRRSGPTGRRAKATPAPYLGRGLRFLKHGSPGGGRGVGRVCEECSRTPPAGCRCGQRGRDTPLTRGSGEHAPEVVTVAPVAARLGPR